MSTVITRRTIACIVGLPLFVLSSCATALPPKELVEARSAYHHAEVGPAAKLVPAELHVARESLDIAEHSFDDSGASEDAIDNAYVAERKAERAQALGEAAAATVASSRADHDVGAMQQAIMSNDEVKLRDTRGQLAHERDKVTMARADTATARADTATARADTTAEHTARLGAEQKAQDAMDALAKSLTMKKDDRGTVITIAGGVLFVTGNSTILPGAQVQLNQVADALKTQAEHHFIVGGHTDSQGTDQINDGLSTQRANAVRDYLIVRGVAADAITAHGFGAHQPIADNKTTEGRAMNRRVEIIVDRSTTTAASR